MDVNFELYKTCPPHLAISGYGPKACFNGFHINIILDLAYSLSPKTLGKTKNNHLKA